MSTRSTEQAHYYHDLQHKLARANQTLLKVNAALEDVYRERVLIEKRIGSLAKKLRFLRDEKGE